MSIVISLKKKYLHINLIELDFRTKQSPGSSDVKHRRSGKPSNPGKAGGQGGCPTADLVPKESPQAGSSLPTVRAEGERWGPLFSVTLT